MGLKLVLLARNLTLNVDAASNYRYMFGTEVFIKDVCLDFLVSVNYTLFIEWMDGGCRCWFFKCFPPVSGA